MTRVILGVCFVAGLLTALPAPTLPAEPAVSVVVGNLLPAEGGPAGAPSPLKAPFGVDFDAQGTMFLVELEGGRVHRLSSDGRLATIAGDGSRSYRGDGGPAAGATFNGMHNVAVTPDGTLYIADSWNHCVRQIDPRSGDIATLAGTGQAGFGGDGGPASQATFDFLMCVSLNPANDTLFVADLQNRRIRAVDLKSKVVRTVAGNGLAGVPRDGADATQSPLVDPRAVAVDSQGTVYVLERSGHALRSVAPDGTIRTVAGTGRQGFRDGPALQAQFASPKHVCVDDSDNVYIADDLNAAIRKFDPRTNTVSTVLGRGRGAPPLELLHPHGVCFDRGRLYAVDMGNNRILSIDVPTTDDWPRFRGPNGAGVGPSLEIPDALDLEAHVLWKAAPGAG
ncbi:MAG: NHL domain-containing protein, partial [Thermoguttaceae bacterium]